MSYPTDLTDTQYAIIECHFHYGKYGKTRKHSLRVMINAVFYLIKSGCQWRMLPTSFPPWSSVHSFYYRAKHKGIWQKMMDDLVKLSREKMGRNAGPTYSLIDSQSTKTTGAAEHRGIDGGKKNQRP
jgi:transposase